MKKFKLSEEEIRPLVEGHGVCFATDYITVDGLPVRYMYREEPSDDTHSGWVFMSGTEDQEYVDNLENINIYHVNTIANYDSSIIPLLDAPIGSCFGKTPKSDKFIPVEKK